MDLHNFQKQFLHDILTPDDGPDTSQVLSHIKSEGGLSPAQRLQVYQNNTKFILADVLKSTYPVIHRLVGDTFFTQMAENFIVAHPARSGDMNHYGDKFDDFIKDVDGLDAHPYMSDVAKLEWQRHLSYLSPQLPPLTADDLNAISEQDVPTLSLHLQPHVYLMSSPYPIDKIWLNNQEDKGNDDTDSIHLDDGACHLVSFQHDDHVALWPVEGGLHQFMTACQNGADFQTAMQSALHTDPNFQAEAFLPSLIQMKLFIKV